jgi:hypothetical protein
MNIKTLLTKVSKLRKFSRIFAFCLLLSTACFLYNSFSTEAEWHKSVHDFFKSEYKMGFDHIYVLSADDEERMTFMKRQLDFLGVDFEFFHAIKMFDQNDTRYINYPYKQDMKPDWQFTYSTISHRLMYEDAYRRGFEKVLFLEDDVEFEYSAPHMIEAVVKSLPNDWEYINFYAADHEGTKA